jgi:hypothetical protein
MATSFAISVDLSEVLAAGPVERSGVFAHLSHQVRLTVEAGEARWKRAVQSAPIWSGEASAYAASIKGRMTGEFSGEITSDYKYVEDIESGRPPYDLKRMLNTSLKVRTSKKGKRYLIIPFRHNTPGNDALARDMDSHDAPGGGKADVYSEAKALSASKITGMGTRRSGTGAFDINTHKPIRVAQRKYVWGDRLPAGMTRKLQTHHKTDPTAGMVRMQASTPKAKSSTYLTFRIMIEGSSGWIIPARPGLWIAKNVADSLQRTADIDLPAAVARDLDAA